MSQPTISLDQIIVGPNPRMKQIFEYVSLVGKGVGSVLITGESGTGKEVIANSLHLHSPRRHKPFVAVSCALFADSLIESELFGHERGAFTGAIAARPGRFERAQGGTLFLDDIDDVPMSMQVKLLRALQNRQIERLGGHQPIAVDVRVVAGSKRDLRQMVTEGKFREDLYYRLNVLSLTLPKLSERRDDLPVLAEFFLKKFFKRRGLTPPPISEGMMLALQAYDWPGNVRELENTCERIAESCSCGHLRAGCLGPSVLFPTIDLPEPIDPEPDELVAAQASGTSTVPPAEESAEPRRDDIAGVPTTLADIGTPGFSLDERLRRIESLFINAALEQTGGRKSRAAELLGVKRSTLGDRIQRCGLDA
ncbi:MAG: sigma-54 interaction domain-containing protein [Vicinamibacterales bacterium]